MRSDGGEAMSRATIQTWGQFLALCIPTDVVESFGFKDGDRVDVRTEGKTVTLTRIEKKLTLEEMFEGVDLDEHRRRYAECIVDWGPDVGLEIVPPYDPDELDREALIALVNRDSGKGLR
jgi:antitoxin component of MazEF toxin-antitoxin module